MASRVTPAGRCDHVPVVDDPRELNLTIDLCLRVGEVLLSSGAGAADVTATMLSVASHLGLRHAEVDVTFTSLSMSYQATPEDAAVLMVRNIRQRDIDYADLTQVDHLVQQRQPTPAVVRHPERTAATPAALPIRLQSSLSRRTRATSSSRHLRLPTQVPETGAACYRPGAGSVK